MKGQRLRLLVLGICLFLLVSLPLSIVASQVRVQAAEKEAYALPNAPEKSVGIEAAKMIERSGPTIGGESSSGNITVFGHWSYEDQYGHLKPTRYARVELWVSKDPRDVRLAAAAVQSDGYYQFPPVAVNGSPTEGYDIYVKLWCEDSQCSIAKVGLYQSNPLLPPIWFWSQTETYYNVTDGYHDMGSWVVSGDAREGWAAYDTIVDGYFWLLNRTGWHRSEVSVAIHHPTESAADLNSIVLYWGDGWDRFVVLHEYGHCIHHVLRGLLGPVGGLDHWFDTEITPWQAFREGWADFFAQAVDNSTIMWGDYPNCGSIETTVYADSPFGNGDYGDWDGDLVEGAIAQVFWDIFDGANPNDYPSWDSAYGDYISNEFGQLWHILKDHHADNISYFWEQWTPKDTRIWAIFHHAKTLKPRNIAVASVLSLGQSITQGETAYVNVTVQNLGDTLEVFNLTVLANSFVIGSLANITLESGMPGEFTLSWNTTGMARGDYTLSAQAEVFPEDLNPADDYRQGTTITIVSLGHDVCIDSMALKKIINGSGLSLLIEIETRNFGSFPEAFNITVAANSTTIGAFQNVFLASGGTAAFTLEWNTTSFPKGNYSIEISVSAVPNETNIANNMMSEWTFVSILGDVDGDFDVDIMDVVKITAIYGVRDGDPRYNPCSDMNYDGRITIFDVVICTGHYGQKWP
jgi:hypothetical protein